jgi:hypothetical protein
MLPNHHCVLDSSLSNHSTLPITQPALSLIPLFPDYWCDFNPAFNMDIVAGKQRYLQFEMLNAQQATLESSKVLPQKPPRINF